MSRVVNTAGPERRVWRVEEVLALFDMPFNDLLYCAHGIHRQKFDPNRIQVSRLLSVKTGGCSEDCAYCSQSSHHSTRVEDERLLGLQSVIEAARAARAAGACAFVWARPGADQGATISRLRWR